MPEFETIYRGREVYVELDEQGCVVDIYPVYAEGKFTVTESQKVSFEIDHQKAIADTMDAFHAEMADIKRSRGRDRGDEG